MTTSAGGRPVIGTPINIRVPTELLDQIDADAAGQRISRSAAIRTLLESALTPVTLDTAVATILDAFAYKVVQHMGRPSCGCTATLDALDKQGVRYVVLTPEQAAAALAEADKEPHG